MLSLRSTTFLNIIKVVSFFSSLEMPLCYNADSSLEMPLCYNADSSLEMPLCYNADSSLEMPLCYNADLHFSLNKVYSKQSIIMAIHTRYYEYYRIRILVKISLYCAHLFFPCTIEFVNQQGPKVS
jgi:hypothetical protein